MPRDLGDVIHYFIPEAGPPPAAVPSEGTRPRRAPGPPGPGLPIVTLPIDESDVVRAAFVWNLAVELGRRGAVGTVIAPVAAQASALWPGSGRGPLGAELMRVEVEDARGLAREAGRAAGATTTRIGTASPAPRRNGLVLVCAPTAWLLDDAAPLELLRWLLLLCSRDDDALRAARTFAHAVLQREPEARVGVTIHGVRRIAEARAAFDHLVQTADHPVGEALTSYGLLVDDLHVYRAIVAQRPIGLAHPQSPAARALADVARLLMDDAEQAREARRA